MGIDTALAKELISTDSIFASYVYSLAEELAKYVHQNILELSDNGATPNRRLPTQKIEELRMRYWKEPQKFRVVQYLVEQAFDASSAIAMKLDAEEKRRLYTSWFQKNLKELEIQLEPVRVTV